MKTFGADADKTTQDMVAKAKSGQGKLSFTPSKSQFSLPKSGKKPSPKRINAVLDAQSDAAIGMPSKSGGGIKAMKMKG